MRKIRIVFFADILLENFDGVSNTLHQIISRLPKDQFEPIFITPHPPQNDFPFPVIQCPYMAVPLNNQYRLALPWKLDIDKLLTEFKPDILHWTSPSLLGEYAIRYGRKRNLPISTIYHTHFPTYLEYYVRWLPQANKLLSPVMTLFYRMYRRSDLIMVPTRSMIDFLVKKKINENSLRLWGRGVDTELFNPNKKDESFKPSQNIDEKKTILFVSRLVKEKETQTLVKVYQLMQASNKDLVLVVVGDGPEKAYLMKHMPEAIFLGKKVGNELASIFASCDVFIFPSVTETFGNVVLEAFASGIPVIVADAGGPSDIVQDGYTGLFSKPKDAADILAKILHLLESPTLRNNMINQARSYAESQNWEDLCADLMVMYQQLAAKNL